MIFLGPRVQDILRLFLRRNIHEYIFSPVQSEDERRVMLHANRKTPLSCGNRPGSNRKCHPKWGPGNWYSSDTFAKAIRYVCRKAFPAPDGVKGDALAQWRRDHTWSPGQLRHTFATAVRRDFGLEASQVFLGHARADLTQVYAERDTSKAAAVALRVG